jgi:diguanylate cyclase (GGDEF)-like protein
MAAQSWAGTRQADRAARRIGRATVVASMVLPLAVLLAPAGPALPGLPAAIETATTLLDLLLAALLLARGMAGGAGPARLGTAFLFAAATLPPHLAALPGGLTAAGLIGAPGGAAWSWIGRHLGFGLLALGATATRAGTASGTAHGASLSPNASRRRATAMRTGIAAVALAVMGLVWAPDPPGQTWLRGLLLGLLLLPAAAAFALAAARARIGAKGPGAKEAAWCAAALLAACLDALFGGLGAGGFTLGWHLSQAAALATPLLALPPLLADAAARLATREVVINLRDAPGDPLTGLALRPMLDERLEMEWHRAQREGRPVSLVLVDLDHFTAFNTAYGTAEGDECLRRVAGLVREVARRATDLAVRYGGGQMALLLPSTSAEGAGIVVERLRGRLQALAIPHRAAAREVVTVSIGIAAMLPEPGVEAGLLVRAVNLALNAAKARGRDRVSVHDAARGAEPGAAAGESRVRERAAAVE